MNWTRRNLILSAAAGMAALGGFGWSIRGLSVKHYPPTPYDDLFAQLRDRDAAARLGQEVLKGLPNLEASAAANIVRVRLGGKSLREAVATDAANGRLSDIQGWILPETLALLSALAARV